MKNKNDLKSILYNVECIKYVFGTHESIMDPRISNYCNYLFLSPASNFSFHQHSLFHSCILACVSRYNGQRMLYTLMHHEDFERMMNKHVAPNNLRNIQDKLDNLKRKVPTSCASLLFFYLRMNVGKYALLIFSWEGSLYDI